MPLAARHVGRCVLKKQTAASLFFDAEFAVAH